MNDNHVPEYWPPQPGDLWADSYPRGGHLPKPYRLWFAISHVIEGVRLVSLTGAELDPDKVRHRFGPMRLIHRHAFDAEAAARARREAGAS